MMFHSEPVLTLDRDVGGIPRMTETVAASRVCHFPLNILEDLCLLRFRCLFVLLIVRPADLSIDFRKFRWRCRIESGSL